MLGKPEMAETCKGNLYIVILNSLHLKNLTFICVLGRATAQGITHKDRIYILEANIMNIEGSKQHLCNINSYKKR
jgi:hypothetical protein